MLRSDLLGANGVPPGMVGETEEVVAQGMPTEMEVSFIISTCKSLVCARTASVSVLVGYDLHKVELGMDCRVSTLVLGIYLNKEVGRRGDAEYSWAVI